MSRDIPKSKVDARPKAGLSPIAPRATAPAANPPEPVQKAPAPANNTRVTRNNTGRVTFDERGNAIWQWAVTTGSFGTDVSTQRLQKLENHALSLADDAPPPTEHAKQNTKGVTQGYSPYDSGLLIKDSAAPRKKTDLRRLSEWLKLREQANRKKNGEDEE